MNDTEALIDVDKLVIEYGDKASRFRAVDGLSFQVKRGECVGFIGANGAGKSSTIKALMGFHFPTSGSIRVFGQEPGSAASRQNIGYLPEVALYYPFMKARELLELYGGLHGVSSKDLKSRIPGLLERVGLQGKEESLLKNFSKGMQQRLGIAQALVSEPEALVFDELNSGLDPIGRHDLRQVLLELKSKGRTVFFSSHELSEVEQVCDRVIILHECKLVKNVSVQELVQPLSRFEIRFTAEGTTPDSIAGTKPTEEDNALLLTLDKLEDYTRALKELGDGGCKITETKTVPFSLEQYFIELVGQSTSPKE